MKKLAAFTLMELLIGMIISSMVISFGYITYTVIYKQYLSYKNVKQTITDVTLLNQLLATDIRNAELVSYTENTLSLFQKTTPGLEYIFYETYILRKDHEVMDTFKIATSTIKAEFIFPQQTVLVKQFSFNGNILNKQEYFLFTKNYSSEVLMNYEFLK